MNFFQEFSTILGALSLPIPQDEERAARKIGFPSKTKVGCDGGTRSDPPRTFSLCAADVRERVPTSAQCSQDLAHCRFQIEALQETVNYKNLVSNEL